MLQDGSSWAYLLFHPFAQGTIRPISQRLPNTVFVAWFGITAWPFRCLEFITFAAVTFMIAKV